MKGDAVGGRAADDKAEAPKLSKGFETLVQKEAAPVPQKKILLPGWFFYTADLLLLAFTVAIIFNAPKPLGWSDWLFCIITTGVAGLFGIIGVLVSANQGG